MNPLKTFEEYIKQGTIIKISPNTERAKNLFQEAIRKKSSLQESAEKIGIKDENANDYIESGYDILMFLIRSKLYAKGYSSRGMGAHEAEVSYVRKLAFNEKETLFLNQLRFFRNGILYYGKRCDKEYAKKVIEFMKAKYSKLKELIG
jgi:hypothetical protein